MTGQRNPEEMPRKSNSNYQEGETFSEPTRVSNPHGLYSFPPNEHLFQYFPSLWKSISTQLTGQGLHWPLSQVV